MLTVLPRLTLEGDELPVGGGAVFLVVFLDRIALGVGDGDLDGLHFPYGGEVAGKFLLGQRGVED